MGGSRVSMAPAGVSILLLFKKEFATRLKNLTIPSGSGRFGACFWSAARSKQHRKDGEDLQPRRILRAAEERRQIEARVARWLPCHRRPDYKRMDRVAAHVFVG